MEAIYLPLFLEAIRKKETGYINVRMLNVSSSANAPRIFLLSKQLLAVYELPLSD